MLFEVVGLNLKVSCFCIVLKRSQNLGMSGQRRFYCIISTILLCCARVSFRGVVAQWVARLIRYRWMPVSREFEPHQRLRCFLEHETLPSLLSTGWFWNRFEYNLHMLNILCSQCFIPQQTKLH